jgi:MFS family permease
MAAFMITGGKLGDKLGRRRAFATGLVVYGTGSALTAAAPTLGVLTLGWAVIEGLGAALVLPALAALVAGAYTGRDRAVAYGVIGGLAGAGIAVGPLLGGWVTTYLGRRAIPTCHCAVSSLKPKEPCAALMKAVLASSRSSSDLLRRRPSTNFLAAAVTSTGPSSDTAPKARCSAGWSFSWPSPVLRVRIATWAASRNCT